MAISGRPSSEVPAKVAEKLTARAGGDLSGVAGKHEGQPEADEVRKAAQNRASGLGALMGYGTGLAVGTAYGVIRLIVSDVPVPLAGVLPGAAAMAASDVPSAQLEVTDPRKWGTSGWLSDIVPHATFGLVTAVVYEMLLSWVRTAGLTLRVRR